MHARVTLRELCPEDGPAVATLGEQTPETGAIAFHSCFMHDAYACLLALQPTTVGVVAETPDREGIVGLGLMTTGQCQYEGAIRPYAYLYSLSVHAAYRRQGIAEQIALWRVNSARAGLGADAVIFAGVQQGNEGSMRTAAKWSTQRLEGVTGVALTKMRSRPPYSMSGLRLRRAEAADLAEIVDRQNAFYCEANLYTPLTVDSLASWLAAAPFGALLHDYYVVVDRTGNIVAGMGLTEESQVITSEVTHLSGPLRLINLLLRFLPRDGTMKRVMVQAVWFADGQAMAVTYLWETLRWLWRGRGTVMMAFVDPRGPLAGVIPQPRFMPREGGSLVLTGPAPLNPNRLLYLGM